MRKVLLCLFANTIIAIFLITGCQKELSTVAPVIPPDIDRETVNAGVRGVVVDENNLPVMGATVISGINTTTTDRYGVFHFSNISLSKANGYLRVIQPGYFTGCRSFVTTAGRIHNVRIKLLPKTNSGSFTGSAGGTVTLPGGGKLVISPSSIADASGNAYNGTVNVAMTWIDPTLPNLPEVIPGDLRGLTASGEERGLETYGMLGVELTNTSGQALKIASGKTAELTFPVPASMAAAAPATIDLWNFDEATGRWKQEGQATRNGNFYVARVSHFSFWNCDAPFPLINLCMTLVNASGNTPLNNVQVRIKRPNGSYGYGWTDSAGNLCGKVPKNEALILEVMDQCHNVVYSQNIGPFGADASLGTIAVTIPPAQALTITGTVVNCTGGNVTSGAAVIYTGNTYSYYVPVTNGTFSYTIIRCSNTPINFSVIGIDYSTYQQGPPVSGTGTTGTVNAGTLQACGTSSVQFVEYLVDGVPTAYTAPPDMISTMDSLTSGTYSRRTSINATRSPNSGSAYSSFTFNNNGIPGTYPLLNCFLVISAGGTVTTTQQIVTANPTVTITAFGPPVTGFIEGNFNVQMNFAGTVKNVVCTFRARRG